MQNFVKIPGASKYQYNMISGNVISYVVQPHGKVMRWSKNNSLSLVGDNGKPYQITKNKLRIMMKGEDSANTENKNILIPLEGNKDYYYDATHNLIISTKFGKTKVLQWAKIPKTERYFVRLYIGDNTYTVYKHDVPNWSACEKRAKHWKTKNKPVPETKHEVVTIPPKFTAFINKQGTWTKFDANNDLDLLKEKVTEHLKTNPSEQFVLYEKISSPAVQVVF